MKNVFSAGLSAFTAMLKNFQNWLYYEETTDDLLDDMANNLDPAFRSRGLSSQQVKDLRKRRRERPAGW